MKKNIKLLEVIILILFLVLTILPITRKNDINEPKEISKKESDGEIAKQNVINYKVEYKGSSKIAIDEINILVTFQSDEKIKSIKCLGKNKEDQETPFEIYGNGKSSVSIDYKIKTLNNYYFIVTTEENSQEEIVINETRPYKIAVNEITTTGFKINLDLTEEEIKNIKEIQYYINSTKEGTNYQTGNTVTGLNDYSKNYVWTIVTYNSGKTQKSSNYQVVYTAHTHNNNCYSETITTRTYYACKYSASKYEPSYKTSKARIVCNNCGTTGQKRQLGYVGRISGTYGDYKIADCHVKNQNCYAFNALDLDNDYTEKEYTVYPKYCSVCESNIYDADTTQSSIWGQCCHYITKQCLNCGKSEDGSVYDYNFL